MAIIDLPTEALQRAGLSPVEVEEWALSAPCRVESFETAATALSGFLTRGSALEDRLPRHGKRSEAERTPPRRSRRAGRARSAFLAAHAHELYDELTDGRSKPIRLEWLVYDAPSGPGPASRATPRWRPSARWRWRTSAGSSSPRACWSRTCWHCPRRAATWSSRCSRRRPRRARAGRRVPRRTGVADLGAARVTRQGRAGRARALQPAPPQCRGRRHARPDRVGRRPDPARSRRARSACCAARSSITPATRASGSSARGSTSPTSTGAGSTSCSI